MFHKKSAIKHKPNQTPPNTGTANQLINPCTAHTAAAACSQPNSWQMRKEKGGQSCQKHWRAQYTSETPRRHKDKTKGIQNPTYMRRTLA